jgi:CysZ protein
MFDIPLSELQVRLFYPNSSGEACLNNHFAADFQYLKQGLNMIIQPGIKRFVLIPLLINLVLITLGFYYAVSWINELTSYIDGLVPNWEWLQSIYQAIRWLIYPVLFISVLVMILYLFAIMANWIGAPFNGLLAEAIERKVTGEGPESLSVAQTFKDLPRLFGREIRKLAYYLPRALGILILFFIPPFSIIAPFIWFIFNAWMMNIQYLDYPMDNHRARFTDTLSLVRTRKSASLGYGSLLMALYMIPIVNILVMPVAVAGSTILWCKRYRG